MKIVIQTAVVVILFFCLFGEAIWEMFTNIPFSLSQTWEGRIGVLSVIVLFICALLQTRFCDLKVWSLDAPDNWLLAFCLVGMLRYFGDFRADAQSDGLLLFFGLAISQATRTIQVLYLQQPVKEVAVSCITALLLVSTAWSGSDARFPIDSHKRWTGPWSSPDTSGILMAVGFICIVGHMTYYALDETVRFKAGNPVSRSNLRRWAVWFAYSVAAFCLGYRLLDSYSRGAWLGVMCGMGYFVFKVAKLMDFLRPANSKLRAFGVDISFFLSNWFSVVCIVASCLVLVLWQLRDVEMAPIHRTFTVFDGNDFSWRNRISGWVGSLEIASERPIYGGGWAQAEALYQQYYISPKLFESGAIKTNSVLLIAATLGLPACLLFLVFVWLTVVGRGSLMQYGSRADGVLTIMCQSAIIICFVGLWFDGAFFSLPITTVFWILAAAISERSVGRVSVVEKVNRIQKHEPNNC